jgi:hypothetical protein
MTGAGDSEKRSLLDRETEEVLQKERAEREAADESGGDGGLCILERGDFAQSCDQDGRSDDEFDACGSGGVPDEGEAGEIRGSDEMGVGLGEPGGEGLDGKGSGLKTDDAELAAVFEQDGDETARRLPETTGSDSHACSVHCGSSDAAVPIHLRLAATGLVRAG